MALVRAFIARLAAAMALTASQCSPAFAADPSGCEFSNSHFHLTNYVQEGISAREALKLMAGRVCRSTLFGIPLQQEWSHSISGDIAPSYYLESDAPLYYYSFTDAVIAKEYEALSPAEKSRFDPMITGFNPADMYAVDHVRRVLTLYPGVFSGIGEFSIHKEFVSAKTAGGPASLIDPALARLLDFAGEAGLVAILHNDIVMPFTKDAKARPYYQQLKDLFGRHPKTTIIWAHMGLGRIVQPVRGQASYLEEILSDPRMGNIYFDLSWDETAKYLIADDQTLAVSAALINKYPDRFLFGTDAVAPRSEDAYFGVYEMYAPLWARLTPDAREKVLKGNYQRLFDQARLRVRAWEKVNVRIP
jgi:hypothetical protein